MKVPPIIFLFAFFLFSSCSSRPKVIEPTDTESYAQIQPTTSHADQNHEVVVEDFLHASRYTYLQVKEEDQIFWIAIPYTDVQKGDRYFYQGGTKMENFKSKEHDRVFDILYLVNQVSKKPMMASDHQHKTGYIDMHGGKEVPLVDAPPLKNGITLSDLFTNAASYAGKRVRIQGTCVKVNLNIMDRNWIHIQDGSRDSAEDKYDLTITTAEETSVGEMVVFEGKIALNRDFGSGYRYDVIMEEAYIAN